MDREGLRAALGDIDDVAYRFWLNHQNRGDVSVFARDVSERARAALASEQPGRVAGPADPLTPPWETCRECGGDHWTKDHPGGPCQHPITRRYRRDDRDVCDACGKSWASERTALARIAAWSRHWKSEGRDQLRNTMRLIHEEALKAHPTALDPVAGDES